MSIWAAFGMALFVKQKTNKWGGLLAGFLYLQLPLVIRLSGTGLNETALVFYGTAVIIVYFASARPLTKGSLVLCGLFAGLEAGTKYTGLAYLGLFAGFIFWDAVKLKSGWRAMATDLMYFLVPAILITLPWYLRSFLLTGNPIFPFAYEIFGGKYWDNTGEMISRELWGSIFEPISKSFTGLLISFKYLVFEPQRLGGYAGGFGQFLPLSFGASIFLMAMHAKRIPTQLWQLLGFTISYYLLWFFLAHTEARYLFPLLPAVIT